MNFCPAEIAEIAERGYAPCHADSKQVIQQDKKFLPFPLFLRDKKKNFCGRQKKSGGEARLIYEIMFSLIFPTI